MNIQPAFPRLLFRLLRASAISLLMAPGFSTAIAGPSLDACALLKPADLTTLLGGTAIATNNRGNCSWTASGSKRKLIAIKYKYTGPTAEMAFAGARQNALGKVTAEPGLGDKAFASQESFGVVLMMLKQGRLLQLMYMTEAPGTTKGLDALLPVAKKAIAAY